MFCGGCFRDNVLVAELRKLGHTVTMVPLYLPLTLDEQDQSSGTPIFFSGINVYLEQKSPGFRKAPRWLNRFLASRPLLNAAANSATKTRAEDLGEITLSMLRGEEGNQARELDELIDWLKKSEKPDVISLSNVLLAGMARRLKAELGVPIICSLQGEDFFLNNLPEDLRESAWETLAERAADIDLFISPSFYFSGVMSHRLGISSEKIRVVYNGISLEGYVDNREVAAENAAVPRRPTAAPRGSAPVLGYFARMCPEKGLDTLVDSYIFLMQRGTVKNLKLKIGGSCGPADETFVAEQKEKLRLAGLQNNVEFHPNISREQKIAFLKSLTVFSVPALYGEAFGLYIIEAMAAGVPVVQPMHGAFSELVRIALGGVVCEPNMYGLADAIEGLLLDERQRHSLSELAQKSVIQNFTAHRMASEIAQVFRQAMVARGETVQLQMAKN